jgi:hypothetical protein
MTGAGLHQEAVADQRIDHFVTLGTAEVPQSPNLGPRQAHPGHFVELSPDDVDRGPGGDGMRRQLPAGWGRDEGSGGHRVPPDFAFLVRLV